MILEVIKTGTPCKECNSDSWYRLPDHPNIYECSECFYPEIIYQEELEEEI
jgi:hypothetical protein